MYSVRKGILLFILFIFSLKSFAGTIKGIVKDKDGGDPLIGAIVILEGTSFTAITGLDGTYMFKGLPAGSYNLKVKYASYEDYTKKISIAQDETLTLNIGQVSKTSALTEVTIKGKYRAGTAEEARSLEKNSDNVMNVMSAREIELLPDITVANVLQRVSGVQVERDANGEARYISIRGMDKRYNYTTVDGVKIASPDDKARFVPLDIFPAEILERTEVIKTLTPDMEGDAIGGVTNLVMKNAPDHLMVYASAATGYNENLLNEHYNSFDKGAILGKDPYQVNGPAYMAKSTDFPLNSSVIKSIQAPVNDLYSATLGNRFFKNKKLGVLVSGSYQNTFKETNNLFFKPASQPALNNTPLFDDLDLRKYSTQETRIGLHANIDYRFNDKNIITLGALFVHLNQYEERNIVDSVITSVNRPGPGLGTVDYKDRTAQRTDNIQNFQLKGKHMLTSRLKVDWTGAYSKATRNVPDMTEFTTENNFYLDSSKKIQQKGQILKSISKSWEKTTDEDLQAFLNVTYTPSIFGKDIEFKVGGMYRTKNRDNYYNKYDLSPYGPVSGVPYTSVQALTAANYSVSSSPTGVVNGYGLDYKVKENISAYYAEGRINFFKNRLEVLGGVRIENTYVYDTANLDPKLVVGVTSTDQYTDVLPSVSLKYKLSSKENLRLSYFSSISRPSFFEVVPYSFAGEDFNEVGNPYLLHSTANNLDARYEWFPKGIDQVLIGAFYKNITDPIEYSLVRYTTSAQSLQPVNLPNPATNYGAEIVITKYFHYFGVTANYTYTHSSVTVNSIYVGDSVVAGKTVQNYYHGTTTRPLQGQAAHVGNIALIYKNPKLGLDLQLGEQYTGRHISLAYNYTGLDYWQRGLLVSSFSGEKRIVKHLTVYVKINNLLNTKSIIEQNVSNSSFNNINVPINYLPYQNQKDGKTLVESSTYGRNYLIGIRYKFD